LAPQEQTSPIESFSVKRERRPQLHVKSAKLTSVLATTVLGLFVSRQQRPCGQPQLTRVENKLWVRNRKKNGASPGGAQSAYEPISLIESFFVQGTGTIRLSIPEATIRAWPSQIQHAWMRRSSGASISEPRV
jgi:hypothetical protein